ncbi:hypothetical protein SteCoe_32338 [Stentor coeruleus]|uniref:Uncharacterized protein n=1 Tax=Stentor coeruleus TaxID=5963 RepID=A0A1R2AZB0_9CILI|nr:hypothetical protein SteCoe_32338 [Stentor coeruleus]
MEPSLYLLKEDDPKCEFALNHSFNSIRPLPGLSFGEILALGYVESLTSNPFVEGRTFLKTFIVKNNENPYPNLLRFINELGSDVKHFEDFFEFGLGEELTREICRFGRFYFPDEDITNMFEFSRRFNAFITYIDENKEYVEAKEFKYIHPFEVSILKTGQIYNLIYRVSVDGKIELIDPMVECFENEFRTELNQFGLRAIDLYLALPINMDMNSKICAAADRIQAIEDPSKKWEWADHYRKFQEM